MWDPITKTFAVPIAQHTGTESFNGLAVYRLDKTEGFTSKGRLDHGALAKDWIEEQCAVQKKAAPKAQVASLPYCNPQYKKHYGAQHPISRSIVVDKYILSLSSVGLEIHTLEDLDVKAALSWTKVQKTAALAR
jgi:hypothetical protein